MMPTIGSEVIAHFAVAGGVTVTRGTAGSYTNGRYVAGSTSEITISEISVQPMSARERQLLPEGTKDKEVIKLYTTTALLSADQATRVPADVVAYQGLNYRVFAVEDRHLNGGYYKALAELIEGGG